MTGINANAAAAAQCGFGPDEPLRSLIQRKKLRCAMGDHRRIDRAESAMSKVLVVVYSYTRTSRRVARLLSQQQGWQLGEITEVRPRSGVLGALRCRLDSLLRRCPEIRYHGPSPRQFDAVVLVSPIWAQRLAGPMRSFVAQRRDDLPDVAVVSVMGDHGAPKAVAEIGRILGRAPFSSTAFTTREVDDLGFAVRLQPLGKALGSARQPQAVARPAVLSPQPA
ncbi:MAG TPA: flavodoxin [Variovorax sp.]|nr:flavodoxin [Variovorax sp.]